MDDIGLIGSTSFGAPELVSTNELNEQDAEAEQADPDPNHVYVVDHSGQTDSGTELVFVEQQDIDPEQQVHEYEDMQVYILMEDPQTDDPELVVANSDGTESELVLMCQQADPEQVDPEPLQPGNETELTIHLEVQETDPTETAFITEQPDDDMDEGQVLFELVEHPDQETPDGFTVWVPEVDNQSTETDGQDSTEPTIKIEPGEFPLPPETTNLIREPPAKKARQQMVPVLCDCGRRFRDENCLNIHRQRVHHDQPTDGIDRAISLKCPVCPAILVTQLRFENHMQSHAEPSLETPDSVEEYVKKATRHARDQERLERSILPAKTVAAKTLVKGGPMLARKGREAEPSVMLRCPECPAILVTEIRFQNHLKRDHASSIKREKT